MISSICSDKKQPERRRHPSQRSGVISVNISAFTQDYKSPRKCCEEEEKRERYRRPCFLCSGSLQTVLCINESGTWASRHKNFLICRVHHQHLYNACHVTSQPCQARFKSVSTFVRVTPLDVFIRTAGKQGSVLLRRRWLGTFSSRVCLHLKSNFFHGKFVVTKKSQAMMFPWPEPSGFCA